MHRVELKVALSLTLSLSLPKVPNAPCGVESIKRAVEVEKAYEKRS